jgi:hypothetical protein
MNKDNALRQSDGLGTAEAEAEATAPAAADFLQHCKEESDEEPDDVGARCAERGDVAEAQWAEGLEGEAEGLEPQAEAGCRADTGATLAET